MNQNNNNNPYQPNPDNNDNPYQQNNNYQPNFQPEMQQNPNTNQCNSNMNNYQQDSLDAQPNAYHANLNDFQDDNNDTFNENLVNTNVFSFDKAEVRLNFIKKVYLILGTQLVITCAFCIASMLIDGAVQFYEENVWLLCISMFLYITTNYALFCYPSVARNYPINYVLLFIFTISFSYVVAFICAMSPPHNVIIAAGLTALMTISLTIYAWTTKTDFTYMGGLLFMLSFVFVGACFFSIFYPSDLVAIIISAFGIILFGIYLIYDTQLIVGKKDNKLRIDDYIIGALSLYIDIMEIFLNILDILNRVN